MKELPILFSTNMVRAVLEGRKTQTRRIVDTSKRGWDAQKMRLSFTQNITPDDCRFGNKAVQTEIVGFHAFFTGEGYEGHQIGVKCLYGQPGDVLWVRESFAKATIAGKEVYGYKSLEKYPSAIKYKPSIHMPKDAARIWLQVDEIRIERLQDISDEDAIAEGIQKYGPFGEFKGSAHPNGGAMKFRAYSKATTAFRDIWEEINGQESWQTNPWVWVIKFKVLSTTGKPQNI